MNKNQTNFSIKLKYASTLTTESNNPNMSTYLCPISLCMRPHPPVCDYCGSADGVEEEHAHHGNHGIQACYNHAANAKRDVRAFLNREKTIPIHDFLECFPELKNRRDIKIPRSDGSITEGGSIMLPDSKYPNLFVRYSSKKGRWCIRVAWSDIYEPEKIRDITIDDLALSGVDTAPMLAALNEGIFKAESDEYDVGSH